MRRSAAFVLALCLLPQAAAAAPKEELAETQAALKTSQEKQAKLAREQAAVERELGDLQEKLVARTIDLQKSSIQLADAEARLAGIERELTGREEAFRSQRKKLDGLQRIAIRLSRTPPQAMVLMPADGKNRIHAAHALAIITSDIRRETELIQKQMEGIRALKAKTEEDRRRMEKIREAQSEDKKRFEAALKTRRQLREKLAASRAEEENRIAALAKKATSLQDLMSRLEEESRRPRGRLSGREVTSIGGIAGTNGRLREFRAAKGRIRIPVSGRVVTGYGDRSAGEASKGLTIETARGAPVVAPFDAEVAYSGTFLNYGKLVILKHRGSSGSEFHTLLSGLNKIDVSVGDFLLEGEPIGAMASGDIKRLYVELRENNQPVNPKGWMRGL